MPQRSPIIAWLLLAVAVCANLVAYEWMRRSHPLSWGTIMYFALIESQLSLVCIWAALRPKITLAARVAPVVAVIACTAAFGLIDTNSTFRDMLSFFSLHAVALLVALWMIRRTAYWQRRTQIVTTWQFSMAQLLFVTTVVALLAAALRNNQLFSGDGAFVFIFLASSVAIAVASVLIWSRPAHWALRLAGVMAIALIFGAFLFFIDRFAMMFFGAHYLVQAMVLSAGLGLTSILPVAEASNPSTGEMPTAVK